VRAEVFTMSQIDRPLEPRPDVPLAPAGEASAGSLKAQAAPDAQRPALAAADPAPAGFEAEGFRIGWEHARYQTTPPADHLHAGHPVRQGWEAGRIAFAGRTLAATRAARMWLELRLQAWLRGRAFEEVMVTPRFVAQIDVPTCPVLQRPLTHSAQGALAPSDAVVMPLYEGAGCAAGNLAVVSRRAAQARAALSATEMAEIVRRLETGDAEEVAGLDLTAWRRLTTLTSLATPPGRMSSAASSASRSTGASVAHLAAQPALQALHVLPPPRVRLLNPLQGVQALLTMVFMTPGYARALTDLGALMPHAQARRAYFMFMNAMLARRLSARGAVPREQVRAVMEQAWSHPLVQQRWASLAQTLKPAHAERLLRLAAQRSAGGPGVAWRWTEEAVATEGWALEAQGLVDTEALTPPLNSPAAAPASGSARSRPLYPWSKRAAKCPRPALPSGPTKTA
jgi:hypothetical protein